MPLPIVPDNTMLQLIPQGSCGDIIDAESVLYGLYTAGGLPTPGGLALDVLATNFLSAYASLMVTFMSASSAFEGLLLRIMDSVTPIAPNRFHILSTQVWFVRVQFVGLGPGSVLPAFDAFTIEKRTFAAGRGRQGSIRQWGIPVGSTVGDRISAGTLAAFQAALTAHGPAFLVGGVGNTDAVNLKVMSGKRVNANPGHPPVFYTDAVQQLELHEKIGSQLSRKFLRRRS